MRVLLYVSDLIVPAMFIAILGYAFYKKVNMYDNFIDGAKEGFSTILSIMPTLIGLMVAVGMLRASGAIDLFVGFMAPFMKAAGFPKEAVPLSLMRLISSSAATGLLLDIFQTHGPDSFIGRFVSVMMSCTETVFYTMSVYFMSVKITKTRYTLAGALFANVAGILASILITRAVF